MKKNFLFLFVLSFFVVSGLNTAFAQQNDKIESYIKHDSKIQENVSNIGLKLLNANKIDKRMIFVYNSKFSKIDTEPSLRKRQIVVYDKSIQFAANDDEIAAFLAREICKAAESYTGIGNGFVSAIQVKCAPKKYELFFDKRAVDFMAAAGYNPVALITFMNKSYPQKRYDKFARTNLTSKRLANIYEYIFIKYPYFLKNNEYLETEAYQNFLLTSTANREKLSEKIKSGSKKALDYE